MPVSKEVLTHMFFSCLALVEWLVDYTLTCRFGLVEKRPQNLGSAGAMQSTKVCLLT